MDIKKLKLAVFISGRGSNMVALAEACEEPDFPAEIELVLSNTPKAEGIQHAQKLGLKTEIVHHKLYSSREDFEVALIDTLQNYDIDLICLAGFMRIFTPKFVQAWEGKILNTHPSLLPKHGGKGMYGRHVHEAVLASGDTESGVSIHIVTEGCDEGPVILQRKIDVHKNDTPETLAERVIEQEHIAYPEAIRILAEKSQ